VAYALLFADLLLRTTYDKSELIGRSPGVTELDTEGWKRFEVKEEAAGGRLSAIGK
jgi:hypothetical protein